MVRPLRPWVGIRGFWSGFRGLKPGFRNLWPGIRDLWPGFRGLWTGFRGNGVGLKDLQPDFSQISARDTGTLPPSGPLLCLHKKFKTI